MMNLGSILVNKDSMVYNSVIVCLPVLMSIAVVAMRADTPKKVFAIIMAVSLSACVGFVVLAYNGQVSHRAAKLIVRIIVYSIGTSLFTYMGADEIEFKSVKSLTDLFIVTIGYVTLCWLKLLI